MTEQERNMLQQVVAERNIRCLYHYTNIANLDSILRNGILSQERMEEQRIDHRTNDPDRFDGQPDGISLSVGFPNYKTFYMKRRRAADDPQIPAEWAVLALRPDLLWELPCAFQTSNAASRGMTGIPLEERRKPEMFRRMFEDFPDQARSARTADWQTTDPQAEVLVFGRIPPEYILYANVETEDTLNSPYIPETMRGQLKVYPRLFGPRDDWRDWRD